MKSPSPLVYGAAAAAVAVLGLSALLFYGGSESDSVGTRDLPPPDLVSPDGPIAAVAEPEAGDAGPDTETGDRPGEETAAASDGEIDADDGSGADMPFLPEQQRDVVLFFQSADGDRLFPELRTILKTRSFLDQAKQVVVELIAGPRTENRPVLPPETRLRELYLVEPGTVCVDFSRDLIDTHSGGSAAELASVYGVVNSLTVNFPEIKRVRILVEGEEREALKYHVDLTRAFVQDLSLVDADFL